MFSTSKALLLGTCFFCFFVGSGFCQDQRVADSLAKVYEQDILRDTLQLELLRDLAFNEGKRPSKRTQLMQKNLSGFLRNRIITLPIQGLFTKRK
jgi:hypothetical protein